MFLGQELFGDTTGLLRVGLISDVVAIENSASSVPRDLHNYRLSDPCPTQIPDRRPPQIVKKQTGDPGLLACQGPALAKILDRLSSTRKEVFASPWLQRQELRHIAIDRHRDRFRLPIHLPPLHPNAG